MKYNTPYGSGNPANLDSLTYRTHLDSPKNFPELFRTHLDLVSETYPKMYGLTKLQDSDSGTHKYLAGEGAEVYFLPVGAHVVPQVRTVFAGTIMLVRPGEDGRHVISIPRSDPGSKKTLDTPEHGGGDPLDATRGKKFDLDPFSDEFVADDEGGEE